MFPRRVFAWLFALTLLFGQAAAFAHVLTHLHAHESGVPDKVCEVCVAQANLGSAAPATVFSLPVAPAFCAGVSAWVLPVISTYPKCAQARAPPAAI